MIKGLLETLWVFIKEYQEIFFVNEFLLKIVFKKLIRRSEACFRLQHDGSYRTSSAGAPAKKFSLKTSINFSNLHNKKSRKLLNGICSPLWEAYQKFNTLFFNNFWRSLINYPDQQCAWWSLLSNTIDCFQAEGFDRLKSHFNILLLILNFFAKDFLVFWLSGFHSFYSTFSLVDSLKLLETLQTIGGY